MLQHIIRFGLILILAACSEGGRGVSSDFKPGKVTTVQKKPTTRFERLDPDRTGITFVQDITESFDYFFINDPYIYNGGGVAVLDFDNDGLQDLYFTSRQKSCKLYRNKGGMQFEDVTDKAGVAAAAGLKTGVAVADVNADGFPDLYVCRTGQKPNPDRANLLFVNNGNGTFSEQAEAYGINDISPSQCANFLDYDLDGDLDLYVVNQPVDNNNINTIDFQPAPGKTARSQAPRLIHDTDRFFRNEGNGRFTDVSQEAGIWNRAWGLSVTATDFNLDGYPDLLVGNDFIMPDFVYINNQKGGFEDQGDQWFRHTSNHTMGVDIADLNNDGLLDLVALDMLAEPWTRRKKLMSTMLPDRYKLMAEKGYGYQLMRNSLQINNGNGTFSELGCLAGMYATDWSWAPLMADYDNDGWKDLFISNGIKRDLNDLDFLFYTVDSLNRTGGISPRRFQSFDDFIGMMPSGKVHNYMYQNEGSLVLRDVSADWGFSEPRFSNGAVYADLDKDGDLDLVTNSVAMTAAVYENQAVGMNTNNWLQIKCKGTSQNSYGIGAKIWATAGDLVFYQEMTPYRGFYSSVEPLIQIGLGNLQTVDRLEIEWPGARYQRLENVRAGQRLILDIEQAVPGRRPDPEEAQAPLFVEMPAAVIDFRHRENNFEDFDAERLLPRRYSRQGPCMAAGDLNGDGLEDVFIGGARDQAAAVFLQTASGTFRSVAQPALEADRQQEDTGAVLFDADADGDPDLYVASGGNEERAGSAYYRHRFYLNDGKGRFSAGSNALPAVDISGKAVCAHDFDNDGDPDLVIGGRVSPGAYPTPPRSFVLRNDQGKFTDVTDVVAPDLKQRGMVTDIRFADLDGDNVSEMLLVGEWMPVTVFQWDGKQFRDITVALGLSNTTGWWNCLLAEDLDGDGDIDLAGGNLGLNTRFKAAEQAPLKVFARDIDGNGTIDPLLTVAEGDQYVTVIMRDYLATQIAPAQVKKMFRRHTPYAEAGITDFFPEDVLRSALILNAQMLQSAWFENRDGQFIRHDFPPEAQVAPVYALLAFDADGDGRKDLLAFGNEAGMEVETGRIDASNGCLLSGDGKGGFLPVANRRHGLWADKEARSAVLVRLKKDDRLLLIGNNNDQVQSFQVLKTVDGRNQ